MSISRKCDFNLETKQSIDTEAGIHAQTLKQLLTLCLMTLKKKMELMCKPTKKLQNRNKN